MVALLGSRDQLLRIIESRLDSDVHVRGNEITISGSAADNAVAVRLFEELLELIESGQHLTPDSVSRVHGILAAGGEARPAEVLSLNILSRRGKNIRPKTVNQKRYVDAIDEHTVVFGIGPAGTGKTYLAVAKAVQALLAKEVNRIILTRPAVEAGERLGFLPGTLHDKIDPYLRPLLDALHDMLDPDSLPRLMQAGTIEIAPLAYMRGRAQPLDATVMTPDGAGRIGDLEVGDLVVGANGRPTPVLGVYPQGRKHVYRVTTQDGASTLACGEHLWTVRTVDDRSHGRPWRTLQTQDMIGSLRRGHVHRYELPVVAPVEFVPASVPMDPYALGLLLGDGCLTGSTTPSFATSDPELADALQAALPRITVRHEGGLDHVPTSGSHGGVITENPVTGMLRRLRLLGTKSHTKFVPLEYLVNSADTRLSVLQGLLDSDGGPVTQDSRTGRIQYTTGSAQLRDDVIWLVRSLGGVAYSRTRAAEGRKPGFANGRPVGDRHDCYVLEIHLPAQLVPFRLQRKRAAYEAVGGGSPMRFITAIEPVDETETVCIQVAAADSLYVTDDFIVTHNTLNDAFIILDEAQNTTPEQMKMFLTRLGFGSKIVVTGDITQVDLPGDQRSGLRVVRDILADIEDVHFANLTSTDVVRHRLVGEIVDAYERHDAAAQSHAAPSGTTRHAKPRR
ncbi:PhoH family protein [Jatrophihabitans sp.]|jgi:phosphate starvation-inducible PhoH-like protein|uniref:PhoH family protein n=1 Tax=Jatrophihabitans sp. TaxID=1932789 RepID=UPI0032C235FE